MLTLAVVCFNEISGRISMPVFVNYVGVQGALTAEGGKEIESLDVEYKYVPIRTFGLAQEADGASQTDLAVDDGSGITERTSTTAWHEDFVLIGNNVEESAASLDPEYKYVPIRRYSFTEEADGESQTDLAADDGSGIQAAVPYYLKLQGVDGEATGFNLDGDGSVRHLGTTVDVLPGDDSAAAAGGGLSAGKVHYSDMYGAMLSDAEALVVATDSAESPGTGKTMTASLLGQATDTALGGVHVAVSDLTGDGSAPVAMDHGVTVLAWARVDGTSRSEASTSRIGDSFTTTVTTPERYGEASTIDGQIEIDSFSWGTSLAESPTTREGGHAGDDILLAGDTIDSTEPATSMDYAGDDAAAAIQFGAIYSGTLEGEPWPYLL